MIPSGVRTSPVHVCRGRTLSLASARCFAIKIFGPDMEVLEGKRGRRDRGAVIRTVPGVKDVKRSKYGHTAGAHRRGIGRPSPVGGINVADVQHIIQTAKRRREGGPDFGGIPRFDIPVRYAADSRSTPEAIEHIQRRRLAREHRSTNWRQRRGDRRLARSRARTTVRSITVQCNVRGQRHRHVRRRRARSDCREGHPLGYIVNWGGQFELQQEANKPPRLSSRLRCLIVFLLLY